MRELYKLTKEQFNFIVEQCDSVLEKHNCNNNVVGIAWLHVLNSHPDNQLKYVFVFNKRGFLKSAVGFMVRTFKIIADLFISIFSSLAQKPAYKSIRADIDILILSHLVSTKSTNKDTDFYYQELPDYLHARSYRTAVALMDHTSRTNAWKDTSVQSTTGPIKFLTPRRLGFLKELSLFGRSLKTALFF
jgi:hypothetical protein